MKTWFCHVFQACFYVAKATLELMTFMLQPLKYPSLSWLQMGTNIAG